MTKLVKGITKVAVVVGSLALSYAMGERIERIVLEDDTIATEDKPMVLMASCTLSGVIIGLIARCIVKNMK